MSCKQIIFSNLFVYLEEHSYFLMQASVIIVGLSDFSDSFGW